MTAVASGTEMIDRTAVSLTRITAMFTHCGRTSMVISGTRMRRTIWAWLKPTHCAASTWPRGTAANPARKISEK